MEERWMGIVICGGWAGGASRLHETGDAHITDRLLGDGIDRTSLMHAIFVHQCLAVGPPIGGGLEKLGPYIGVANCLWNGVLPAWVGRTRRFV